MGLGFLEIRGAADWGFGLGFQQIQGGQQIVFAIPKFNLLASLNLLVSLSF